MDDEHDTRLREQALAWALERIDEANKSYTDEAVLATAQKFYAFLKGEELPAQ